MWAQVAQTRKKIRLFGKNLRKERIHLIDFCKIRRGKESPGSVPTTLAPNFTIVALEISASVHQNHKKYVFLL